MIMSKLYLNMYIYVVLYCLLLSKSFTFIGSSAEADTFSNTPFKSLTSNNNKTSSSVVNSDNQSEFPISRSDMYLRNKSSSYQKYLNSFMRKGINMKKQKYMALSFVNGIYHTEKDWERISEQLNELFGLNVKAFYNPTSGWWVSDATKAGFELALKKNDVATAKLLAEHLRSMLNEISPYGRILHLAHSGGAILTYLAAKHHLRSEEKDRIDVATFGGGRSITRKYFRGRITNYYARNDPLLMLDGRANKLMKIAIDTANTSYCEVKDRKHNTTFVYLQALANNPLTDHSMEGPTYRLALKLEAENFKARLTQMLALEAMDNDWVRLARKKTASITGVSHFWESIVSTVGVRSIRKRSAKITKLRGFFSRKVAEIIDDVSIVESVTENDSIVTNSSITTSSDYNNTLQSNDAVLLDTYNSSDARAIVSIKMDAIVERTKEFVRLWRKPVETNVNAVNDEVQAEVEDGTRVNEASRTIPDDLPHDTSDDAIDVDAIEAIVIGEDHRLDSQHTSNHSTANNVSIASSEVVHEGTSNTFVDVNDHDNAQNRSSVYLLDPEKLIEGSLYKPPVRHNLPHSLFGSFASDANLTTSCQ